MVWIVDADTGNLRSLCNALKAVGVSAEVRPTPSGPLPRAVILPGVGSFGFAALRLAERGWTDFLRRWRTLGGALLGICLGMQLLFESSEESPGAPGLGLLPGRVRRLSSHSPRLPHVGWARIQGADSKTPEGAMDFAYFVHSYVCVPAEEEITSAFAEYGEAFPAVVRRGRLTGVQFHPEKSQRSGLAFLRRWKEEVLS